MDVQPRGSPPRAAIKEDWVASLLAPARRTGRAELLVAGHKVRAVVRGVVVAVLVGHGVCWPPVCVHGSGCAVATRGLVVVRWVAHGSLPEGAEKGSRAGGRVGGVQLMQS